LLHEMLTGRPPFEGSSAEDVFQAISEFSKGGARAAEELQRALIRAAESLTDDGASFLLGLLTVRESERIGAGPSGFLQIQQHAWFVNSLDWEEILLKQATSPWVPPESPDGATAPPVEFSGEDVMIDRPFDPSFDSFFAEFGPYRKAPWGDRA